MTLGLNFSVCVEKKLQERNLTQLFFGPKSNLTKAYLPISPSVQDFNLEDLLDSNLPHEVEWKPLIHSLNPQFYQSY